MAVRFGSSGDSHFRRSANVPTLNSHTVCGWAQRVSTSGTYEYLLSMDNGDEWYQFGYRDGSADLILFNGGTGDASVRTYNNVPLFWAVTSSGNGVGLRGFYVRGLNEMTLEHVPNSSSSGPTMGGHSLYIGSSGFAEPFNGNIWNVKCWDRALTAEELLIESFYSRVMFPSSLNFHWPMFNAADTRDISGNARTATTSGTIATGDGAHGLWRPRRKVIYIPSTGGGPQIIPVNQTEETDSAFALGKLKRKAVGLNTETDSTQAVTALQDKTIVVGQATETDSTQTVARLKRRALGLNTETDSVTALAKAKLKAVGLNTETDSVLAATRVKVETVGLNTETDSTHTPVATKLRSVQLNTETDEALSLVEDNEIVVEVGLATETDAAQPVTRLKQKLIGMCLEVAEALGLGRLKTLAAGLNTETDSATSTTSSKSRAAGLNTETDSALPVAKLKRMIVGLALEFDSALSFITGGVAPTGRRGRTRRNVRLGTYERGR